MGQLRAAQDVPVRPPAFALSWPVQFTAIASLAVYLHSLCWWTKPRDMDLYLGPWFQHLVRYGPIGAFSHPFSNYTPSYLYLLAIASLAHQLIDPLYAVKILSVAGSLFAAWAVADLVKTCGGRGRYAVVLLATPSFVINAALLAQCDALWAGACVLAVSAMIAERPAKALIWCGIAVAFKAQAAFIAPFIIGALIGRRAPLWQWLIPPAVFVAMMVPAWLAGWPAWQLAMVYPGQAAWGDFPGRLANPWMAGTVYAPEAARQIYWLGFASAAVVSVVIGVLSARSVGNRRAMLILALLSSLALPFFLPKMLERYYFLAGLISIAFAISYPSRATVLIAAAIETASFLSLITYMYFYAEPYAALAGTLFAGAALVTAFTLIRSERSEPTQAATSAAASHAQI